MTNIDSSRPVLVTGATGYVASWLIKRLLDEGLTVHAAVRDPKKTNKIAHLNTMAEQSKGNIVYFKSDLLVKGSYGKAMEGCELVFHTASPFISKIKDPQKDLIDPAVGGTENILDSASQTASVKRIVLTSSCAAVYNDAIDCLHAPNGTLTEAVWNNGSSLDYQPYSFSKTLAEKKAWTICENQEQWDLVVINPSLVLGPWMNPKVTTSESFAILKQLGDGTMKMGAPKLGLGMVDVRDVAEAHYQAAFNPSAKGRYITSGHNTNFLEMSKILLPKFGKDYPLPSKPLPKWLLMLVGPFTNKLFTRRFIRNNVNIEWKADNSKIKNDLGIAFRPMQETMEDAFQILVDEKVL